MRIELLKPHTHAEVHYAPGNILNLDDAAARWLIDLGVARSVESTPAATTKSKGD